MPDIVPKETKKRSPMRGTSLRSLGFEGDCSDTLSVMLSPEEQQEQRQTLAQELKLAKRNTNFVFHQMRAPINLKGISADQLLRLTDYL